MVCALTDHEFVFGKTEVKQLFVFNDEVGGEDWKPKVFEMTQFDFVLLQQDGFKYIEVVFDKKWMGDGLLASLTDKRGIEHVDRNFNKHNFYHDTFHTSDLHHLYFKFSI